MKLSIVIVNFNGGDYLLFALKSIRMYPPPLPYEVIVIDNQSRDGSFELARAKFPEFTYIRSERNRGYGGGCNLGMKYAKGEFIAFANPDIVVQKGTFNILLQELNNNGKVGIIGPKLLHPDGSFQPSCRKFPKFKYLVFGRRSFLTRYIKRNPISREFMCLDLEDAREPVEVECIMGAFMLSRREIIREVGGFDEQFFLFAEDVDLCHRIKKRGWKIIFTPNSRIIHYHGQSRRFLGLRSSFLLRRSILSFFEKHRPLNLWHRLFLGAGIILGTAFSYFTSIFKRKTD